MAAIDDFKTIWTAYIYGGVVNGITFTGLTDPESQAEAAMYLDDWYNAKAAHAAMVSGRISSYSISGRSISRRSADQLLSVADAAFARCKALVFGGYHRVDMSQVARTDLPISGV